MTISRGGTTDRRDKPMECSPKRKASDRYEHHRWVFSYCVKGDIRYLAHRDMLRSFERALVRAGLPVRFTEGFNPHARLSIPLPRPVGVASSQEALVVEFDEPIDGENAAAQLNETTPSGIEMVKGRKLRTDERLRPALACYRLELSDGAEETMQSRIQEILQSKVINIQRRDPKNGTQRLIDIRPSIVDLRINGRGIDFVLSSTNKGTARPAEIAALLGFDPRAINHRICRTEIQWQ